jgi:adenosylcobinamide-phosphate synthase
MGSSSPRKSAGDDETMSNPFAAPLLALGIDALVGDPPRLYRRITHPVALFGYLVARADRTLNTELVPERTRRLHGGVLTVALTAAAALLGAVLAGLLGWVPGGWVVEAVLASTLVAARGLYQHVRAVADALAKGIEQAREAVRHIVGRDPETLDTPGVARAAIESAAENFSDGVVAPLFWYCLLGLGGLFAYKAINTMDSMLGHRDARYEAFGKTAARVVDIVNWVPARLAGLLFVLAAVVMREADAQQAWHTMWRDAPKHRSLNAGWQEAAVAGALGFALAGPRRYAEQGVDDAWMGHGRKALDAADIRLTLRLYVIATIWLALGLALASLLSG